MKNYLLILFLIAFLAISCSKKISKKESDYIDLNGETVHLESFRGKKVLVNFWATWCTPCLQEMPSLVRAQEILTKDNYVFLFPSTDEIEKIKNFNKSKFFILK